MVHRPSNQKVFDSDIIRMRAEHVAGKTMAQLAREFGISSGRVRDLVRTDYPHVLECEAIDRDIDSAAELQSARNAIANLIPVSEYALRREVFRLIDFQIMQRLRRWSVSESDGPR